MIRGLDLYADAIGSLKGEFLLLAALLFFLGLMSSVVVVRRENKLLLWYPLWIWRCIQRWVRPRDPFIRMVVTIFCLNATSLLANILSGLLGVLPFVFAYLVGLHVGVIVVVETGRLNLVTMLLNPVAFLELPATWISLSLGMELGLVQIGALSAGEVFPLLRRSLSAYGLLIVPLLLAAAFLEVSVIKWGLRVASRREKEEGVTEVHENHSEGAG
jgi:hypothetical protein